MFYCTIIDDSKSGTDLLSEYIGKFSNLRIYRIYNDPLKALNEIPLDKSVHFMFMDIEMPGLSGTDLAKLVRNKTNYLIFTTAHNDRAAESHEVRANGYLLKPITFLVFANLINELLVSLASNDPRILRKNTIDPTLPYFYVKQIFESEVKQEKSKKIKIEKKDLVFIETQVNYVHIFTSVNENYIRSHLTLKVLMENFINEPHIMQVHRSFVVNMDKVAEHSGDRLLVKIGAKKQEIPIGGGFMEAVVAKLNNREKGKAGAEG